jgi:hypothetical protein
MLTVAAPVGAVGTSAAVTDSGSGADIRVRKYPPVVSSLNLGVFRCSRRACFVCFFCVVAALPELCLRRRPMQIPCRCCFKLSGYYLNAVQLHVNAADVLVKRGIYGQGLRKPPIAT